jgi:hypothetical protein
MGNKIATAVYDSADQINEGLNQRFDELLAISGQVDAITERYLDPRVKEIRDEALRKAREDLGSATAANEVGVTSEDIQPLQAQQSKATSSSRIGWALLLALCVSFIGLMYVLGSMR